MILPVKCPRIQTGCCAFGFEMERPPEKDNNRCERLEEYIYCEHYSGGVWGHEHSVQVMQIVQSTRRR